VYALHPDGVGAPLDRSRRKRARESFFEAKKDTSDVVPICILEIWLTHFLPSDIRPDRSSCSWTCWAGVRLIVDVRTIPRSRTNPQYHRHVLTESLSAFEIGYEHIAGLGGLRGRKRDVPPAMNAFWENQSFHNYADYAMTEDFHSSLIRLRELGHAQQCAIMCAETV